MIPFDHLIPKSFTHSFTIEDGKQVLHLDWIGPKGQFGCDVLLQDSDQTKTEAEFFSSVLAPMIRAILLASQHKRPIL